MTRLLISCLLLFSIVSCKDESKEKIEEIRIEKLPHDFMFMQRAYPLGTIKTDAYSKAIQWKKQPTKKSKATKIWEFSGPTNIGGRITDIEIPSMQPQTYFVGAASGGIFKTTDAGANWNPIFDDQQMLSIGDIEISKTNNNLVWVGTGEVNAGGGSLVYDGDGIYKSNDGGITWQTKGLPEIGSVGKIVIDPNNNDIVFVGAMGPIFKKDVNRGVYKTVDGGDSWNKILFVSDSTGIIDMAIHPSNSTIVYAASWERIRRPNMRQYGGETSRIYRSIDGGNTWDELTNGLPTLASDKGRISIDISISNPNVLYARYANAAGSIEGIYRTSDGGDNWIEVNSSQLTNVGFHWWFRGIYVDPTDENTIYNVDFVVEKSIDGGNNWFTAFPNVHVDQHALAFNASVNGEVLLGNDGGFYKSGDNGASSTKDLTLPITQFYRFHVDAQDDNKIYGGTQDNSTMRTVTGSLNDWTIIFGGDGFQPLVDPINTNTIFALSQRGVLGKSTNNGLTFNSVLNGINASDPNNWDTPIVFDPTNSQVLYYGTNRVYKTTNSAFSWAVISPDLSNGPSTGNLAFGTITSIGVSSLDATIIYAGTDDGNVWKTDDSGTNWNLISSTLPDRWVTKVLTDRTDANTVYVTFSGYRYGEDSGHVYKSIDKGSTWIDISGDLPDIPINDIEKDIFGNLFLGTDIGVLASNNEGVSWQVLGDNLPSVVVTDLHIHEASGFLYAATYGRSSYKIDINEDILDVEDTALTSKLVIYPNPVSDLITISFPISINDASIIIYDQLGKVQLSKRFFGKKEIQLDISSVKSGIYFMKITGNNTASIKKIIIN